MDRCADLSEALVEPLSEADATIQSMEDASPAKWHLAHTTWFWETFLLRDHAEGYRLYDEDWPFVFNSYYEAEGERIARFLARDAFPPYAGKAVLEWRAHVDEAMAPLFGREELAPLIELGLSHEQQHQELLLTDIKHALFQNPLGVAMWEDAPQQANAATDVAGTATPAVSRGSATSPTASPSIAKALRTECCSNPSRSPRGSSPMASGQQFIADGGYETASLWLSDGWAWVNENAIGAPSYWRDDEHFTHNGWLGARPASPCHAHFLLRGRCLLRLGLAHAFQPNSNGRP